ncbi:hypothetical protein Anapl_02702 [Anas platyrhynchos]|uniref:Uncharacterized protein n=1 Tax=Anas platyrhynchos TaxID=8839 RepID=R0L589_ANAPL|nr:hypothetical protein Anapl_02702 [Anas platyrhynchos]
MQLFCCQLLECGPDIMKNKLSTNLNPREQTKGLPSSLRHVGMKEKPVDLLAEKTVAKATEGLLEDGVGSHTFSAVEIAAWFETTFFALVSLFCAPHLFREPSVFTCLQSSTQLHWQKEEGRGKEEVFSTKAGASRQAEVRGRQEWDTFTETAHSKNYFKTIPEQTLKILFKDQKRNAQLLCQEGSDKGGSTLKPHYDKGIAAGAFHGDNIAVKLAGLLLAHTPCADSRPGEALLQRRGPQQGQQQQAVQDQGLDRALQYSRDDHGQSFVFSEQEEHVRQPLVCNRTLTSSFHPQCSVLEAEMTYKQTEPELSLRSQEGPRDFQFLLNVVNEVSVPLALLSWFSQGILRT